MRGHKFVCLVNPTYHYEGCAPTIEIAEQIHWSDDAFMEVLTFPFPDMKDNLVEIEMSDQYGNAYPTEKVEFARTIDGRLYYVSDWYSKQDIINKFEQTD